jgi:hypothetical protein
MEYLEAQEVEALNTEALLAQRGRERPLKVKVEVRTLQHIGVLVVVVGLLK